MKKQISESRLRELISEEALRMKKRLTLEAEKKSLVKKLNEMIEEDNMEEEGQLTEGAVNDEAGFKAELQRLIAAGGKTQKGTTDDLIPLAAKNKFKGYLSMIAGFIQWKPADSKFTKMMGKLGAGTGSQTAGV